MATAPVKPHPHPQQQQQQPLHNFPLSLKWGQPPPDDPDTPSDPEPASTRHPPLLNHRVGSRSARLQRLSFASCSTSSSLARPGPLNNPSEKEEENLARPWKLRPRKQPGGGGEVKEPPPPVPIPAPVAEMKFTRLRGGGESSGGNGENKKKMKFWIALSREEIEEDVFVMTGSRPARRPRKRPKNIQRLLDSVFPGLCLVGTSADYYRVADAPVRR